MNKNESHLTAFNADIQ